MIILLGTLLDAKAVKLILVMLYHLMSDDSLTRCFLTLDNFCTFTPS